MEDARRVVLVTGGSRGIGRAIAERFAAAGDRVAVHYRSNQSAAEETLAALGGGSQRTCQIPEHVPSWWDRWSLRWAASTCW
jgi:NAD(P)-dependent dehydrogenase (short-subunit alcohol dehydrogenase family)